MNNQPYFGTEGTFTPTDLVIDVEATESVVIASGNNILVGDLLGKKTIGAATPVKTGTGNGTFTMDATTPILANAQVGVYTAVCTVAGTNTFTFEIRDPKGNLLGTTTAGATFANQLKFVIADGSTDFIVGDSFAITVAAGSGEYVKSLAAAVDGSQYPVAIASEDIDATSAAKTTLGYIVGTFNSDSVNFGTGHTLASTKDALRGKGIILQPASATR